MTCSFCHTRRAQIGIFEAALLVAARRAAKRDTPARLRDVIKAQGDLVMARELFADHLDRDHPETTAYDRHAS